MTTYRLFPSANGPALLSYSGDWLAGICFSVGGQVMWFEGYWWWVPAGGATGAQKFALWNHYASASNQLISGSVVTSGTLSATPAGGESGGHWNFVALPTPIQLAPGTQYVAASGLTGGPGVPYASNAFGSGDTYAAGIVNGPLTAWSAADNGGSDNYPGAYAMGQGQYSTALGHDASVNMPDNTSNSPLTGMDISVSGTAPGGYSGTWSPWPNMYDAEGEMPDLAKNYILGLWLTLAGSCTLGTVDFYSPATATQLPTEIAVWDPGTQTMIPGTHLTGVSWSGAAGSGWVTATYSSPPLLPAAGYVVAVFNGTASPGTFNATTLDYFTTGFGAGGLTAGPVTVPDATGVSPGQSSYQDTTGSPSFVFPDLYVAAEGQNYWIRPNFTPAATAGRPLTVTSQTVKRAAFY